MKTKIAIIGGGPGGLFANYLLEKHCGDLSDVTIFEASGRLGGKILTERFKSSPLVYEGGVAELYGYQQIGGDPLKSLIRSFKLETLPMKGPTVTFGDRIMRNDREIKKHLGEASLKALDDFITLCEDQLEPVEYYEGFNGDDNSHPWAGITFAELLDRYVHDEQARRYIEVMVRSDTATEPWMTSGLNALKNVLMDDPDFLRYYTIKGGIEQLIDKLKAKLHAKVKLNSEVKRIAKAAGGGYDITVRNGAKTTTQHFEIVLCALPNYWLSRIEFAGDLKKPLVDHLARYANPAHYLRVSVLFKSRFWEDVIPGDYWITDAFGGACVYNDSLRHNNDSKKGVLSWLIAGDDALALNSLSDDDLVQACLDTLPADLAAGRKQAVESKVHRWLGAVNGLPGGHPTPGMRQRHEPSRADAPNLFVCGDYMFDSTVNGTFDSADFATDLILTELRRKAYGGEGKKVAEELRGEQPALATEDQVTLSKDYHDEYALGMTYEESFKEYFCEHYTCDLIETIWEVKAPFRLLDCGSASGLTLPLFQAKGVEAWGVENNEHIHSETKPEWLNRNLLGDIRNLPFEDGFFDMVYDTSLCYVPEEFQDQAISELFRVCRIGVFFGGITSDMTKEVIEYHEIFDGVQVLETQWCWAERFMKQGFKLAVIDPKVLRQAWKIECDSNEDDYPWYPNAETMRYCFFSKPDAAEHIAALKAGKRKPSIKVPRIAAS